MKELMVLEDFFYALHDYPEKVLRLAEQIEPYFQQIQAIGADSPRKFCCWAQIMTTPLRIRRSSKNICCPRSRDLQISHRKGKFLMTHTDGENQKLFPLYHRAGFDIADSVCPSPMTR